MGSVAVKMFKPRAVLYLLFIMLDCLVQITESKSTPDGIFIIPAINKTSTTSNTTTSTTSTTSNTTTKTTSKTSTTSNTTQVCPRCHVDEGYCTYLPWCCDPSFNFSTSSATGIADTS